MNGHPFQLILSRFPPPYFRDSDRLPAVPLNIKAKTNGVQAVTAGALAASKKWCPHCHKWCWMCKWWCHYARILAPPAFTGFITTMRRSDYLHRPFGLGLPKPCANGFRPLAAGCKSSQVHHTYLTHSPCSPTPMESPSPHL